MNITLLLVGICLVFLSNCSSVEDTVSLSLTIYSDFGLVKDTRTFSFDKGDSSLNFQDVASTIQSQTVSFKPLDSNASIRVYQQNYEYNLASKYGILKKYINKEVTVQVVMGTKSERVDGVLLAYEPAFLLKTKKGVSIYDEVKGIHLKELPDGFITLPTLVWKVWSPRAVGVDCLVAYRATGFSWKADYIVTLNENETKIALSGWVTIDNNSGKKYQDTKIKLIAGDVNTVNKYRPRYLERKSYTVQQKQQAFKESSFSDYHMYTLQRTVDLNQNSQKQIEFIPTRENITIRKYSRITVNTGGYTQQNLKADNVIEFQNSHKNKLGIAFPKGVVRVFKSDTDKSLEFVGQDKIEHTPRDQKIKLTTGKTFDISIEKKILSKTSGDNWYDAEVMLEIRNHKNTDVEIQLKIYNSYGDNLDLTWSTPVKTEKKSAYENIVTTKLASNQTVQYEWKEKYRRN